MDEYLKSYGTSGDSVDMQVIHGRFDFFEKLLSLFFPESPKNKKMLDIGCGGGFLLKIFQEKGWKVQGLDVIDSLVEYGRRVMGIPIDKLNFETAGRKKLIGKYGYVDLVVLTDALEHFFEPFQVLKKIRHMLKNDGVLFLTVPNIQSISFACIGREWAIISPLEHISYFSPKSLRILLENVGFQNIGIRVLQYVNCANVHQKNLRYRLGCLALYLITRMVSMGFEGRESFHDILNGKYLKRDSAGGVPGDIIFAVCEKGHAD